MGRPRKIPLPLEEEAKKFTEQKRNPPPPPKPLTARRHIAGAVLGGLIARSTGIIRKEELKREAYEWADYMLSDDD